MLPAKKEHQQDEHSLIWTPRQAYAQDDKKGKKETFKQPLNQWTWLIVSQQITNKNSKSITLQVPKPLQKHLAVGYVNDLGFKVEGGEAQSTPIICQKTSETR